MSSPLLEVDRVNAGYGSAQVLHGVSLEVREGEIVGLIGANGAGKSTLMRTISGLLKPDAGGIRFRGREIGGLQPHAVLAAGISHVAEGRRIFKSQSVRANIDLGSYSRRVPATQLREERARVYDLFPVLEAKADHDASLLSGGEQQMLAIGQAMMAAPALLLMDEPSLGLAPIAIWNLVERLRTLREAGLSLLLVEQQLAVAESICDRLYLLRNGEMVISGVPLEKLDRKAVRDAYV